MVPLAWPVLLSVALYWPLLTGAGYPLARDLVLLPHQPFTWATVGAGDVSPRAVPLDAAISLITSVVDGGLVARVVLPLIVAVAGIGVMTLLRPLSTSARLLAGGVAVWNPFVVERLALGQWALLTAYAALPWLLPAAARWTRGGRRHDLGSAIGWTALGSLTPTGGLVCVLGLLAGWRTTAPWRSAGVVASGVLLQAPWVVTSVVGAAGRTSDPAGVSAFAPDTEGPYGVLVALLGLGGIWDARSEPASRSTPLALVSAGLVLLVVVLGTPRLRRLLPAVSKAWLLLSAGGTILAVLTMLGPGQQALEWAVAHLPGAGLFRDGQKFLLPAAGYVAMAAGASAQRLLHVARRWPAEALFPLAAVLVLTPLLTLPDAAVATWRTVRPVELPRGLEHVAAALEGSNHRLVVLPWRSYRNFSWGTGETSSDPAVRLFDVEVVVDDRLAVGDTLVDGESSLAAEVGSVLGRGVPADLAALGVGHVLVYRDDPAAAAIDLSGLREIYRDDAVGLYEVPGAQRVEPVPRWRAVSAITAHVIALLVALGGLLLAARSRRRCGSPDRDAWDRVSRH